MLAYDDFDPANYMTAPRTDVASTIALSHQLLAAAPPNLPTGAESAKKQLLTITKALSDGYRLYQGYDAGQDRRPIDQAGDTSWACVKTTLEVCTWLNPERIPAATRAKFMMDKLFPTGLAFLKLEYGAQWAEANWRIEMIAKENLEPELRRLCGDLYIDELFYWHKEYAKMVGVIPVRRGAKAKVEAEPRPNLLDLLRQSGQAIVAWQAQLVALHLSGHPGARAGLRPTDEYRAKLASAPRTAPETKLPADAEPTPAASPSTPFLGAKKGNDSGVDAA